MKKFVCLYEHARYLKTTLNFNVLNFSRTASNEVFADPMALPGRRRHGRKRYGRRRKGRGRSRSRSGSGSRSRSRSHSNGRRGSRSRSGSKGRGYYYKG